MTETAPTYHADQPPAEQLPKRALNLARRMLQAERDCGRRGRIECQVIMLDGNWYLTMSKPGKVEAFGEWGVGYNKAMDNN